MMTRAEIEKWKARVNQRSKVKFPVILLENTLNENRGEFYDSIEIAKFISYTLPEHRDEATKIYLDVLTKENIQAELMKIKAHKESIFHQDEEVEQLVESIVFGCYTACQCFRQNEDLDRAFEFIKLAIQVVEEQGSGLGCLRKGDLYYTKWRILEELGKECELVDEIDRLLFTE